MAAEAKIDPKGKSVSWTITISDLKVGVYRAVVFDKNGVALKTWENQRTDDALPDAFEITKGPKALLGGTLWWQAIVIDPTDAGGPYVGTVSINQGGSVVCQDSSPGVVPNGKGKMDLYSDQICFIS